MRIAALDIHRYLSILQRVAVSEAVKVTSAVLNAENYSSNSSFLKLYLQSWSMDRWSDELHSLGTRK